MATKDFENVKNRRETDNIALVELRLPHFNIDNQTEYLRAFAKKIGGKITYTDNPANSYTEAKIEPNSDRACMVVSKSAMETLFPDIQFIAKDMGAAHYGVESNLDSIEASTNIVHLAEASNHRGLKNILNTPTRQMTSTEIRQRRSHNL